MEFRILGPVEMGERGHAADLGGPRERALLARLLVSANHVVAAHQIADDLWSGNPPPRSLATLRVYVSRLRRALGPSASALMTRQPRLRPLHRRRRPRRQPVRAAGVGGNRPAWRGRRRERRRDAA